MRVFFGRLSLYFLLVGAFLACTKNGNPQPVAIPEIPDLRIEGIFNDNLKVIISNDLTTLVMMVDSGDVLVTSIKLDTIDIIRKWNLTHYKNIVFLKGKFIIGKDGYVRFKKE